MFKKEQASAFPGRWQRAWEGEGRRRGRREHVHSSHSCVASRPQPLPPSPSRGPAGLWPPALSPAASSVLWPEQRPERPLPRRPGPTLEAQREGTASTPKPGLPQAPASLALSDHPVQWDSWVTDPEVRCGQVHRRVGTGGGVCPVCPRTPGTQRLPDRSGQQGQILFMGPYSGTAIRLSGA